MAWGTATVPPAGPTADPLPEGLELVEVLDGDRTLGMEDGVSAPLKETDGERKE